MDFIQLISDVIILMKPTSYSKLKMAIENLSSEGWFRELYADARYTKVIWHNNNIKKVLLLPGNVEMIKKDEKKAQEFIELVKSSISNK
ncbi:hypothetical protein SRABI96_05233 [Peribacillus sp. Bi96]|uniref:hypothetical protein n=1 Tax=unclassified Peribacillus TaxID=2675266 RepID=UPI001DB950D9|nr:hypothetical protein [Peribacillus sp. Bi96]CAH0316301.1 hypothetical protein SRABI96_05233 [Peribacillus sp. Bi96]